MLSTGPGSVEHAHLLRQWSEHVVFLAHDHELPQIERDRLEARGIRVVEGEVRRLVVEADELSGVELAGGQFVSRKAVFIRPNMRARGADLFAQLGCDVDDLGFVRVDDSGRTSVNGVGGRQRHQPACAVITAAGEGSAAAISINTDLVQEELQDASRGRPR